MKSKVHPTYKTIWSDRLAIVPSECVSTRQGGRRVRCHVIAPALIPRKPGDRIKTDRRDARKLAELQRAGVLTDVRPPTPREEAVRDLARARDDARDDLQRGRQRICKFLLRHGLPYAGKHWTRGHRAWVAGLAWEHEAEQQVVDDYLLAIDHLETRLGELDAQLAEHAASEPSRTAVGALRCFHGIDTLTAMLILAELHDFRRFPSPWALMAYLGLVPGEASSGERHRRGGSRRRGTPWSVASWWKPPGTIGIVPAWGSGWRAAPRYPARTSDMLRRGCTPSRGVLALELGIRDRRSARASVGAPQRRRGRRSLGMKQYWAAGCPKLR